MDFQKIKLLVLNFIGFLIANPIFAYVLGFAIFLLIAFGYISSCQSRQAEKKDKQNQKIIEQTKGKIEILEEERQEKTDEAIERKQESEQSEANFNAVTQTDSSKRDSNFDAVRRKWCEDHQNDSKCQ